MIAALVRELAAVANDEPRVLALFAQWIEGHVGGTCTVERAGTDHEVMIPLEVAGEHVGVVTLTRTAPYTADELALVRDAATHAALAIAYARLRSAGDIRDHEASRLKSELLANMSHELRTPLNAIIGFASLLHAGKVGPLDPTHVEYIGDILQSSRHLLQLINDVLDLAKLEAGRTELRVETIEIARCASEVLAILRGLAADKSIRVKLDLDPTVTHVQVDARLLKQLVYNYLSNAIKFTPDRGSVTLRTRAEGDHAFRIEVEDTGIGIAPHDLDRLYHEFQQLDPSAKRYKGTGLGLALVKRIVEAQGGRVFAKSRLGEGSTFTAVLPREVEAHA